MAAPAPGASRRLIVRSGTHVLALDAASVREVVRLTQLTPVPLAPPALRGLASLRGRVVPVVSVARMLGDAGEGTGAQRMVVLRREDPIALAVDDVDADHGDADGAELADLDALLRQAFASTRGLPVRHAQAGAAAPMAAPARRELGILTFLVAGQAYGLPLASVREVLRAPADILALPNPDAVALGVIPLRDGVLAVVSPAALLGLGPAILTDRSSIVVAALGPAVVGLLVDSVRSVARVPEDALRPVPAMLNRGRGEAGVQSIARTIDGLVAVLSPERLFDHQTVADLLAQTPTEAAAMTAAIHDQSESFLIFRLGGESYGLPAAGVVEVINLPEALEPPPAASRALAGVMNHRGMALAVIDPAHRLGLDLGGAQRRRVIVLDVGGQRCGLIVDAVESLTRIESARLSQTTELAEAGATLFHRAAIVELEGRPVLFVDPAALLDDAERRLIEDLARTSADSR